MSAMNLPHTRLLSVLNARWDKERRSGSRERQSYRSERYDRRSNNKRSFKAQSGKRFNEGKRHYTNKQNNQSQENQGYQNNRYTRRGDYRRGGYQRQRGTSKPSVNSNLQDNLTNTQQGSGNISQGENLNNYQSFDVGSVNHLNEKSQLENNSQSGKDKKGAGKKQLDFCGTNFVNLTKNNRQRTDTLKPCGIRSNKQLMSFVADSGATEHLVNTEKFLDP